MTVGPGGNNGQVGARTHEMSAAQTGARLGRELPPPMVERGALLVAGHSPRQITAWTPRRERLHVSVYHLQAWLSIRLGPKQLPRVELYCLAALYLRKDYSGPNCHGANSAAIRHAERGGQSEFAASFQSPGLRRRLPCPLVRLRHAVAK